MRTRLRTIQFAAACATLAITIPAAAAAGSGEDLPPTRIIGGQEAEPGAYPFVVAVVDRHVPDAWHGARCAGSVVAPDWVLTAASCVHGADAASLDVVAGRHDLTSGDGARIEVAAVVLHPRYDDEGVRHDAALLQLSEPLPIDPIRLAAEVPSAGTGAIVTGWGDTHTEARHPARLHQAGVTVADPDLCLETYGAPYDTRFMICAGEI